MVTQNNQNQANEARLPTAEEAATIINSMQSLNSLGNQALLNLFSVLQGSFRYADQFEKLMGHINTPVIKNRLHGDEELQDKILSTVNHDVDIKDIDDFGKFFKAYQRADVFSSYAPVKHKFDKKAIDYINNYASSGMDEPTILLHLEDVIEMVEKNKSTLGLTSDEMDNLDKSIASIKEDVENFVLANDLENLNVISQETLEANFKAAEKIASEHKAYEGSYAAEMKDALTLLSTVEIVDDASKDKLTVEKFKKELDILVTEQAKQKCMLDPDFASKKLHEQKIQFIQTKSELIKDFVKEQNFLQEAVKAGYKLEKLVKENGVYAYKGKAADKANFIAFRDSFDALYNGKVDKKQKIKVGMTPLLAALHTKHQNNVAVGQYIEKKRGFTKVLEVAKVKREGFWKRNPNFTKYMKDAAVGIAKVGAIVAIGVYVAPAAALVASAGLAVWSVNKMRKGISAKYKKGKTEGKYKNPWDYVKGNKFEVGALAATALGAIATAGVLSGNIDGTTRTAVMIGAAAAGSMAIYKNKEMDVKQKRWAIATTATVLTGGVVVANLFGGGAAGYFEEKLNATLKEYGIIGGDEAESSTIPVKPAPTTETQHVQNEPSIFEKGWLKIKGFGDSLFGEKDADDASSSETKAAEDGKTETTTETNVKEHIVTGKDGVVTKTVTMIVDGETKTVVTVTGPDGKVISVTTTEIVDGKPVSKIVTTEPSGKETTTLKTVGADGNVKEEVISVKEAFKATQAEDYMPSKVLALIENRNASAFGDDLKVMYDVVESGRAESLPAGMSSEEYIYKLGQLIKLAPVVHKESIDLILKDLGCDDIKLTQEQIAQVHESLKTIDALGEKGKIGDYYGKEPTARTCNVVTGIHFSVDCGTQEVKIDTPYIKGNCDPVVVEKTIEPTKTAEPEVVVKEVIKEVIKEVPVDREVIIEKEVIKEVPVDRIVKETVYVEKPTVIEKIAEATSRKVINPDNTTGHVAETISKMNAQYGTNVVVGHNEAVTAYEAAKSGDYFIMGEREFLAGEKNADFIKALNSKTNDVLIDTKGNLLLRGDSEFFNKHAGDPDQNPLRLEQVDESYFKEVKDPNVIESSNKDMSENTTKVKLTSKYQAGDNINKVIEMYNLKGNDRFSA